MAESDDKAKRNKLGDVRIKGRGRVGQDMGQKGTPAEGNPEGKYPFPDTSSR